MSYFICDNCRKEHYLFGNSQTESLCSELDTLLLGKIPFGSLDEGLKFDVEKIGDAFEKVAVELDKVLGCV